MQPLADACQCPVVAFDRPGFGLTSRPSVTQGTNPYTLEHAAEAAVQLCLALGFTKMIFAGHADGAVVGLVAVANLSQHMQR
jgi:pimeloyl-ACP methyl ester carboxylesterase